MRLRKFSHLIVCITTGVYLASTPALAATQPAFSTCINPQTPQQLIHTDGTHGVPGDQNTYSGTDTIYSSQDTLSSSSVMQCLCPENGQGIQTNWWKASELSDSEIKTLEAQGWIYIPDGSAWGLDSDPYLAQNTNFSCNASAQLSSSSSNQPSSNSNQSSSSSNNNSSISTSSSSPIQSVLGAFTELANTGDILILYSVLILGLISSGLALILRKK